MRTILKATTAVDTYMFIVCASLGYGYYRTGASPIDMHMRTNKGCGLDPH